MQTETWTIGVEEGAETSAVFEPARSQGRERSVLILAPGAGAHMDHPTVTGLSEMFRERGLDVVRFNFLYRALGRGRPDPMPRLKACYRAVIEAVRGRARPDRLLLGGRSLGGRTASMLAADGVECDGLVLLAYPLHPAGRPEALRDAHLSRITVPVLCLNGTRDALCRQDLMDAVVRGQPPTFTMHWLDGADHGFHVLKRSGRTDDDVRDEIGRVTDEWMRGLG